MDLTEFKFSTFACQLRQLSGVGPCGAQQTLCSNTVLSPFECLDCLIKYLWGEVCLLPLQWHSSEMDTSASSGPLCSCNKYPTSDSCLPLSCRSSRPAQTLWLQGQQCLAPRTTQKVCFELDRIKSGHQKTCTASARKMHPECLDILRDWQAVPGLLCAIANLSYAACAAQPNFTSDISPMPCLQPSVASRTARTQHTPMVPQPIRSRQWQRKAWPAKD